MSSLAIPAYLASAASTLPLQQDILSGCSCTDDSYLQSYLSWSSSFGAIPDTLPARQPFSDCPGIQADRLLVESSLISFSAGLVSGSIAKVQRGLALCPLRRVA